MQVDIYQSVTASIIADLEKGAVPWAKPWKGGNNGGIMPINYATRRQYENGYPTAEWLTFKQAQVLGANVKKGAKGTRIVFTKKFTIEEGEQLSSRISLRSGHTGKSLFLKPQIRMNIEPGWSRHFRARARARLRSDRHHGAGAPLWRRTCGLTRLSTSEGHDLEAV